MKHIETINEIFGINGLFHKDEKTAKGILNRITNKPPKIKIGRLTLDGIEREVPSIMFFNVDDFSIKISNLLKVNAPNDSYILSVDNVELDTSDFIGKKIFYRCREILNDTQKENDRYIKKDAKIHFNESFIQEDKKKAISSIVSYISKNSKIDLYEYEEIWHIKKKELFLLGQLFLSLRSSRAVRFNWITDDLNSQLHSIDTWSDFIFDTKPDFTLEIGQNSVISFLPQILDFIKDPKSLVNEELNSENYDPQEELNQAVKRLSRLRSPQSIASQERKIAQLKAQIANDEISETDSEKVTQLDDDLKIDIFKAIERYTIQVAKGKSNSLIITGSAGVGKSQTVKDTLDSIGKVKDEDYYFATGTVTTAGLYEVLYKNRKILTIFDDCDAVFKEADSINLLKGALDTYRVREISKLTKGNTFDSKGMDETDIQQECELTGKLPNKFEFIGQIIFISNLPESKFDAALLSRALHIDVHLNKKELFDRMKDIMRKLSPDVDEDKKEEALEYLTYITDNYPTKFDMNIRTLIHSINLRANNEDKIKFGDREEEVWKLLMKRYLVKIR